MKGVETVGPFSDLLRRGFGTALLPDVDGDGVGPAEGESMRNLIVGTGE